ncbi:Hypothetical protein NTJ_05684 [Nesidiocoris tenuis]|uniref:Amino acid transporter transmembrane domain-containing protein n=1 Tax=Nesidiocoris tenuis TaxID=355587 RepID=A0ABN7AKW7_9HEMI|nr:Hypothetical protein NTJ_05684 [Nesidiocoris tenuis]
MKIDIKDKFFWFVFVELLFGFGASVLSLSGPGYVSSGEAVVDSDKKTSWLIVDICVPGAMAPLVYRSNLYTYGKELGKVEAMVLMITTAVLYLVGGIVLIILKATLQGIFSVIAGGVLVADAIFTVK